MKAWIFYWGDSAWKHALRSFDEADPLPLAELVADFIGIPSVRSHVGEPPPGAANRIEDILAGRERLNRRRTSARKLSPSRQRHVLREMAHAREVFDHYMAQAEVEADEQCVEVTAVRKRIEALYKQRKEQISASCGLSVTRLEELMKPAAQTKRG